MNALQVALTKLDPILIAEGSRGSCVVTLQKVLRLAGSYSGFVDGIFGPQTRIAIEVLQEQFELPITGVFDSNLWCALAFDFAASEMFGKDVEQIANQERSATPKTTQNARLFAA